MKLDLSTAPLPRLESALAFQQARDCDGKPLLRWAEQCEHVARCGGVCQSCLKAEIARRMQKGAKP